MCGIIGFISKQKTVSVKRVFAANAHSIMDRGIHYDELVKEHEAFGYARLPTDDVENTELNTINSENEQILLYNGLITNTGELTKKFQLPPQCIESDSLCLKYGLTMYGTYFLSFCRGMFAFALITPQAVILGRDSVGIKPLYYISSSEIFGFCSEIKGLRQKKHGKVIEIAPGEIIRFNRKQQTVRKEYFTHQSKIRVKKNLHAVLEEAVVSPTKRYLQQSKHNNVAILCSGGLDSSVLLGLLQKNLNKKELGRLEAFSIGVPGAEDRKIGQKLCGEIGIKHSLVTPLSPKQSLAYLPKIIEMVESPLARVAKVALLQTALAKHIQAKGIKIVISGEGADELFYGYERFINGLHAAQIETLNSLFLEKVFFHTLLQRYDRVFARHQIEGRVPFLDQEVMKVSHQYTVKEKIGVFNQKKLSKLPLRFLAQELGLPRYVYERPKVKMTPGATQEANETSPDGYLETYCRQKTGQSFSQLCQAEYKKQFYRNGHDIVKKPDMSASEEELSVLTAQYHQVNKASSKQVFSLSNI